MSSKETTRRRLSITAGIVAGALALIGCAGGTKGGADEEVKLTMWLTYGGCEAEPTACNLEEAYTKLHPNVTFENVVQPADNYFTLQKTASASKTGPDLFHTFPGGNILDMQDYLVDLNDVIPEADQKRFTAGLDYSSANYTLADGLKLAPVANQAYIGYYHRDLFEAAGITTPPKTWDEMATACDALSKTGVTPLMLGDLGIGTPQFYVALDLSALLGGAFSPEEVAQLAQGELAWTDPRLEAQLENWHGLYTKGCFNENVLTEANPLQKFESNEAALIALVSPASSLDPAAATDVGVMPLPYQDDEKDRMVFFSGFGYSATNYGKHVDVATDFLKFVASEDGQKIVATTQQPAMSGVPMQNVQPTTQDIADLAASGTVTAYPFIDNVLPGSVYNAAQGVLPSVLAGQQSPADALKVIQAAADAAKK